MRDPVLYVPLPNPMQYFSPVYKTTWIWPVVSFGISFFLFLFSFLSFFLFNGTQTLLYRNFILKYLLLL